jgi:hypothetical protein
MCFAVPLVVLFSIHSVFIVYSFLSGSSFSVGLYIYFCFVRSSFSSVSVSLQSLLLSFQKTSHYVVQLSSENGLFVAFVLKCSSVCRFSVIVANLYSCVVAVASFIFKRWSFYFFNISSPV